MKDEDKHDKTMTTTTKINKEINYKRWELIFGQFFYMI